MFEQIKISKFDISKTESIGIIFYFHLFIYLLLLIMAQQENNPINESAMGVSSLITLVCLSNELFEVK